MKITFSILKHVIGYTLESVWHYGNVLFKSIKIHIWHVWLFRVQINEIFALNKLKKTDGSFYQKTVFSFKELGPDEYEEMEDAEEEEDDDDSADMEESDEEDEEARPRRLFDVPIRRRRYSRLFQPNSANGSTGMNPACQTDFSIM